jgi:hypothetical protein
MTSQQIIDRLDSFHFHDLVVERIEFLGDKKIQLVIIILPFGDDGKEYKQVKLVFSEIIQLETDKMFLDKDSEIELSSFDYDYSEHFNCRMIFLLGFGKPSFTIALTCGEIHIVDCD